MSAGDRDTLAALLAEHTTVSIIWSINGLEVRCSCGALLGVVNQRDRFPVEPSAEDRATWCAHVADVLLASGWLADVKADAFDAAHDGPHCVNPKL